MIYSMLKSFKWALCSIHADRHSYNGFETIILHKVQRFLLLAEAHNSRFLLVGVHAVSGPAAMVAEYCPRVQSKFSGPVRMSPLFSTRSLLSILDIQFRRQIQIPPTNVFLFRLEFMEFMEFKSLSLTFKTLLLEGHQFDQRTWYSKSNPCLTPIYSIQTVTRDSCGSMYISAGPTYCLLPASLLEPGAQMDIMTLALNGSEWWPAGIKYRLSPSPSAPICASWTLNT